MKEEFEKIIAPTDSRFRSDVKQLELGDLGIKIKIFRKLYTFLSVIFYIIRIN